MGGFSGSKPKEITCTHGVWDDWEMNCYSDCPRFKIRQTDQEWSNNGVVRENLHLGRESAMRKSGSTTALKFLNDEDAEDSHFFDRERNYVIEYENVNHGTQLKLSCAKGYGPISGLPMVMATGTETLECVNGAWQATEANVNDPPIPMRTLVCDVCYDKFNKGPKEHAWVDDQGRGCDFYAQRASYCIDNKPAMDNCRVACRTCDTAASKYKIWARKLSMKKVVNSFTMEKVFKNSGLTDESTVGELANVLDLEGVAERHPEHWKRKKFRNYVSFRPELIKQERKRIWRTNYQKEKPKKRKNKAVEEDNDIAEPVKKP